MNNMHKVGNSANNVKIFSSAEEDLTKIEDWHLMNFSTGSSEKAMLPFIENLTWMYMYTALQILRQSTRNYFTMMHKRILMNIKHAMYLV